MTKSDNIPVDLFSGKVNIKWKEGIPAPVRRVKHTAVWLNGLVYVGGGTGTGWNTSYTINSYDPVHNSWSSTINAPYCHFAMTTLNNSLLIAGGQKRNKKTTQILTLDAGQLKNYTNMRTARSSATAAGHQGILIVTAGKDDKDKTLSSTELFDSTNRQWYNCSDLPQPHSMLRSAIVDNFLYLLGGYCDIASAAVYSVTLDSLSTHQLEWNTHQDTPWCLSAPVGINVTHLLLIGGCKKIGDKNASSSDIYKFMKVNHSWEAIGQIPSARHLSAAVSTDDNQMVVIGGVNDKGEYTNTVWIGSCEPQ